MEDSKSNIWILMSRYLEEGEIISEHMAMPFYHIGSYHSQIPRTLFELDDRIFKGSSFGCLVLQNCSMRKDNIIYGSDEHILMDIASMQKWDLPRINHWYQQAFLTSTPTDLDCRILFLDGGNKRIMFCRPTDTQVQIKDFADQLDEQDILEPPILYQGQLYCTSLLENSLFRVEFNDSCSSAQIVQVADALPPYRRNDRSYRLVESNGDLLLLEIMFTNSYPEHQVYSFKVYKLDAGRRRWDEVNDIGDYAILYSLQHTSSVYAPDYQMKKNSIYYFVRNDLNLNIFNLEDRGITNYLPHPDAALDPNLVDVEWLRLPAPIHLG